jgi:hypothetical protein
MRKDQRDDNIRRDTDDLSRDRSDDIGEGMPGVGMGGASLAGAGRVYDDLHTRDEVHDQRHLEARLVHLDDVDDFKVADGDPDIRGWDVRTADGRRIGKVEDLIVDTGQMKVRYIEATLDRDVTRTDGDRHVLIPIGTARLDDDEDDVYLSTSIVDPQQLPEYNRSQFNRDFEVSLRGRFGAASADLTGESASDFYRGEMYDDARFFGSRRRGRESSSYISASDDHITRDQY